MTNTADLRAAAELATPGPWGVDPVNEYLIGPDRSFLHWDQDGLGAIWENRADAAYIALASPDRILGLLDELADTRSALNAATKALREADAALEARESAPSSELEAPE